jgi:hypothetical protein
MIVSCGKSNRIPQDISSRRRISRTRRYPTHQLRAGPTKVASEKGSGSRRNAATGSGRNGFRIRMRTVARTHFAHHLLTARTHAGVTQCTHMRGVEPAGWRTNLHPLVGASALHGVSGSSGASLDVRGQWPISVQTPHLPRCLPVHPGTRSGAGQTSSKNT